MTIKNVVTTDRYDMNYVSTPQNVTRLEFLGGSDMRHATKIARESENSSGNMTREVQRTGNENFRRSMTQRHEQMTRRHEQGIPILSPI